MFTLFSFQATDAFSQSVADNALGEKVFIAQFSEKGLEDWESHEFNDETTYVLRTENDGKVLQAMSKASASGMFNKTKVDIKKYPYLNWRWKVNKPLENLNEEQKSGDDYAARIYVLVSDGWFFWQTKALNYVWSSREQSPESWPNAYAPDNTLMMPLRNNSDGLAQWHVEKRNIQEDLKAWLGKTYEEVEAIAIMTDADDSKSSAEAMYGDIYFSSH
jgi:hypothetical protein